MKILGEAKALEASGRQIIHMEIGKKNFGMRFIYVVSSAYILLPIIYAVFRMWHRWEYQFRAYFGDFYF